MIRCTKASHIIPGRNTEQNKKRSEKTANNNGGHADTDSNEDIVQKTWIDLPRFWTAQAEAMRQKTGMVVTTDIPDVLNDIHPPYKWIVGERLCRWALNRTYGFSHVECQGPTLKGVTRVGDKVILEFDHCDGGLVTSDGKQPDWFWANTRNHGSFRKEEATIDPGSQELRTR